MKNFLKGGVGDLGDYEEHLPFEGRFLGVLEDGERFEIAGMVKGILRVEGGKFPICFRLILKEPPEVIGRMASVWFRGGSDFPGMIVIEDNGDGNGSFEIPLPEEGGEEES